ncbi:MAG: DUF2917 domain-containing protein, partial [Pseudomonadota bacterium]|nr:DUF2917 domain-containing protein [Pseudomonadota bacterium]
MINSQESKFTAGAVVGARKSLSSGQVLTLGTSGGEVSVLRGRVWLTSPGDLDDHVLEAGESFNVASSGPTLIEAWNGASPALVAWRPRTMRERARDGVSGTWGRCWELMHPAGRAGIGTAAALTGIVAAALLFGPLSEARVRSLVPPATAGALLHNASGIAAGATEPRGSFADGSDTR